MTGRENNAFTNKCGKTAARAIDAIICCRPLPLLEICSMNPLRIRPMAGQSQHKYDGGSQTCTTSSTPASTLRDDRTSTKAWGTTASREHGRHRSPSAHYCSAPLRRRVQGVPPSPEPLSPVLKSVAAGFGGSTSSDHLDLSCSTAVSGSRSL